MRADRCPAGNDEAPGSAGGLDPESGLGTTGCRPARSSGSAARRCHRIATEPRYLVPGASPLKVRLIVAGRPDRRRCGAPSPSCSRLRSLPSSQLKRVKFAVPVTREAVDDDRVRPGRRVDEVDLLVRRARRRSNRPAWSRGTRTSRCRSAGAHVRIEQREASVGGAGWDHHRDLDLGRLARQVARAVRRVVGHGAGGHGRRDEPARRRRERPGVAELHVVVDRPRRCPTPRPAPRGRPAE